MSFRNKVGNKQSELTYPDKGDENQGLGQGSAYAGAGWTFTDAKITEHYKEKAHPLLLACPQEEIVVEKSSEAFVDDRKLVTEADNNKKLAANVQADVIHLQQALEYTGGAMNVNKSSWSCISNEESDDLPSVTIPRLEYERERLDELMSSYQCNSTFSIKHEI